MFNNKKLLITGGTGSFGNAVLERFLETEEVQEIRIFSRDEKKQDDMRKKYKSNKLKFYIGDVRDYSSILNCTRGVDFIFHAAALKQVPSCEFYPLEAVKTNIIGTENVLEAAIVSNVSKVVCLSTDKAVYPINAMGISKAMMEKVMVSKSRTDNSSTMICGTRYGNVMASRGSVIPLFLRQIFRGHPITITDPNMTRFMMTLDNAVDLVLHAFNNGRNGDIFVQKSPAATIEVLVQSLLKITGKHNSNIQTIGTRHGEKLYEVLCSREEMLIAQDQHNYYRIPSDNRNLNYSKYHDKGDRDLTNIEDYNSHNTNRLDVSSMVDLLMELDFIKSISEGGDEVPEGV